MGQAEAVNQQVGPLMVHGCMNIVESSLSEQYSELMIATPVLIDQYWKFFVSVRKELMKTLNVNYPYMAKPKLKNHSVNYMPKSQSELPVRKMRDSFDTAIVPLSTNLDLRDTYTAYQGNVRIGRLMEDVDLFAGYVSPFIKTHNKTKRLVD